MHLDIRSNISINPNEMLKYDSGHVLSDVRSIRRMKNAYPLVPFPTETLLKTIEFNDFHILFFIPPFYINVSIV